MLAKRLARHRLPLSAGVLAAVLSEGGALSAVPLTLATATVRAAAGGAVPAGAASAAEGIVCAMSLSNLKLPVLALVAFTAVAVGAALVPGRPQPAGKPGGLPGTPDAPKVWATTGKVEIEVRDATQPAEAAEAVSWGEAVNGLQAGVAYADRGKHGYGLGERVTFVVWLRNASGRKAAVSFWSPPGDDAGPVVVGTDRQPRQAYPEVQGKDGKPAKVIPPPVWHYAPHVVERLLQPGEVLELSRPALWLVGDSPSGKVTRPTLAAAPGRYRVHFPGPRRAVGGQGSHIPGTLLCHVEGQVVWP